jgi:CRISPR/Cas system-associated exonuclease Cas4 (RecB family)
VTTRYLSPTSLQVLQACPLRLYFREVSGGAVEKLAPAAFIGILIHRVLNRLVQQVLLAGGNASAELARVWDEEVAYLSSEQGLSARTVLEFPGYQVKRSRARHLVQRLEVIWAGRDTSRDPQTEVDVASRDGLLVGRIDLVLPIEAGTLLIDYKSGAVLDAEVGGMIASYRQQLELYAYLFAEQEGQWPVRAGLLPLVGDPVEISVDPAASAKLADLARGILHAYNQMPKPPAGTPSPGTCAMCTYAARCATFWESCESSWSPSVLAVQGMVTRKFGAGSAVVSIDVLVERGTLAPAERVMIRAISVEQHPEFMHVEIGHRIRLVGLSYEKERNTYLIRRSGRVAL